MRRLDSLPWFAVLGLCATLGLAPYTPEPHAWEKLKMLAAGRLSGIVDTGDLAMHLVPWMLLMLKTAREVKRQNGRQAGRS